jgi:hypothetical protein
VTLTAAANCSVPKGTKISNSATVSTQTPERDVTNNSAQASVVVSHREPSLSKMSASPSVIWPADNRWVDVRIDYKVADSCGPVRCELKVKSDGRRERDDDDDDDDCGCEEHHRHKHHHKHDKRHDRDRSCNHDHPKRDWIIIDDHHVKLRATKRHDDDHEYEITAACVNQLGLKSKKTIEVEVSRKKPKSK